VAAARRRDQDLFGAALQMRAGFRFAGEQAGALEYDVHAEIAPGQLGGIALGEHPDPVPIDDHRVAFDLDVAREFAVRCVIPRQVRVGLRIAQVVQRDDLDIFLTVRLVNRTQHVATDSAVTVDSDFDGHDLILYYSSPLLCSNSIQQLFGHGRHMIDGEAEMPEQILRRSRRAETAHPDQRAAAADVARPQVRRSRFDGYARLDGRRQHLLAPSLILRIEHVRTRHRHYTHTPTF